MKSHGWWRLKPSSKSRPPRLHSPHLLPYQPPHLPNSSFMTPLNSLIPPLLHPPLPALQKNRGHMHKELVVRARGTLGISYHIHRVSLSACIFLLLSS